VQGRAALLPGGIVVILGDLLEAELLIVVGANPFGRIDGALFQGRIDIAICCGIVPSLDRETSLTIPDVVAAR
jgi:hypothetical protein